MKSIKEIALSHTRQLSSVNKFDIAEAMEGAINEYIDSRQPIRNCTTCKYEDGPFCLDCNKISFPAWEAKGKTNREQLDNESN